MREFTLHAGPRQRAGRRESALSRPDLTDSGIYFPGFRRWIASLGGTTKEHEGTRMIQSSFLFRPSGILFKTCWLVMKFRAAARFLTTDRHGFTRMIGRSGAVAVEAAD
jgi:hypothetical protein